MPVKRRSAKGRKHLDSMEMEELLYGPGTCLLAGCGYYQPHHGPGSVPGEAGGYFWELTEAGQQRQIDIMRADWERCHQAIMEAWSHRTPHAGDPAEPWALTAFGDPNGSNIPADMTQILPSSEG